MAFREGFSVKLHPPSRESYILVFSKLSLCFAQLTNVHVNIGVIDLATENVKILLVFIDLATEHVNIALLTQT